MFAQDLCRSIALKALGAGVPAHNAPLGVEKDQGIIHDVFHEQAEPLIALAQRRAGACQLAGHGAEGLVEAGHLVASGHCWVEFLVQSQPLRVAGHGRQTAADAAAEEESHAHGDEEGHPGPDEEQSVCRPLLIIEQKSKEEHLHEQRHGDEDHPFLENTELGPHAHDPQGKSQRWRQRITQTATVSGPGEIDTAWATPRRSRSRRVTESSRGLLTSPFSMGSVCLSAEQLGSRR